MADGRQISGGKRGSHGPQFIAGQPQIVRVLSGKRLVNRPRRRPSSPESPGRGFGTLTRPSRISERRDRRLSGRTANEPSDQPDRRHSSRPAPGSSGASVIVRIPRPSPVPGPRMAESAAGDGSASPSRGSAPAARGLTKGPSRCNPGTRAPSSASERALRHTSSAWRPRRSGPQGKSVGRKAVVPSRASARAIPDRSASGSHPP